MELEEERLIQKDTGKKRENERECKGKKCEMKAHKKGG